MVTVALLVSPTSREDEVMIRVKSSLPSTILSLFIVISNEAFIIPAGIVTLYGPEL